MKFGEQDRSLVFRVSEDSGLIRGEGGSGDSHGNRSIISASAQVDSVSRTAELMAMCMVRKGPTEP